MVLPVDVYKRQVPETVIDHGPNLLWLRKDWMEELGLEEPETLEDAFEIIDAFVQNRMGTEDGETPVGLACDTNLVGCLLYTSRCV